MYARSGLSYKFCIIYFSLLVHLSGWSFSVVVYPPSKSAARVEISVWLELFAFCVVMWVCGVCHCSDVIGLVGPSIAPEQLESETRPAVGGSLAQERTCMHNL